MNTSLLLSLSIPIGLAGLLAIAATVQTNGSATSLQKHHAMMANGPHHLLAMAYHTSMGSFARALQVQSALSPPINISCSRSAVAEIRRNFDQMRQHLNEHMKTTGSTMNAERSNMIHKMETHQSELGIQLTALEKELEGTSPDAKKVAKLAASIHSHLDSMSRIRQWQPASKLKM